MRKIIGAAIAAALTVPLTCAHAVVLNPRGTGQVLIYPYYTVNGGNGTLLSLVNTTLSGKALKVRFLEGYDGREVLSFNLYLSPFDAWVAQTFDTSADGSGAAAVASNDNSCTVPAFSNTLGPNPGQGPRILPFTNAGYSGASSDGGATGLARTHEGYVEIIEMGEVTDAEHGTLDAITHGSSGVPSNCAQIVGAWAAGGYWTANAASDLTVPAGGLYGAESIINVGEGTLYTVNAEAIDGFSSAIQHTAPGNAAPDLNSASKSASGTISAFVPTGGSLIQADYPTSQDAISALFMADNLFNEYVVDPNVGAASDWIITFPTKRFYTDPALLTAGATQATPPFDAIFSSAEGGTSCAPVATQFWNREELTTICEVFICGMIPEPSPALCYATSSLTIGSANSSLGSHLLLANTAHTTKVDVSGSGVGFTSGWMRTDFTVDNIGVSQLNHALPSTNGVTLLGLPALGFLAVDYVNANVTPGVLANYSGAYPHRAHVTCIKSTNVESSCP